jgi:Rrf2 family protein
MKLSLRGEYAMRALVVLGENYSDAVIPTQSIATQQNIPKRFLEQILNDLKSGGFVESRRGVSGGHRLAKAPGLITLAEVLRHIEGAIAPVSCVSENFYKACTCPDESTCAIRSVMKDVREAIVKVVEHVTISDLCERKRKAEVHQGFDYVI